MSDMTRIDERATDEGAIDEGAARAVVQRQTLRTSQGEQARGYLESLANSEIISEMQHALRHAERLTHKCWRVVIAADRVEISADVTSSEPGESEPGEIELDEETIALAAEEAAAALAGVAHAPQAPRIKLPPPHPRERKPRD